MKLRSNTDIKDLKGQEYLQKHYPVVEMKVNQIIPTTYNWHKATGFKQIIKLYKYHRPIYDSWVKQGKLPEYAVDRVRQFEEMAEEV